MKATQARPMPEVPKKLTLCAHCGNPCTYIYGYVNHGQGAVCSRFCNEAYQAKGERHENARVPAV